MSEEQQYQGDRWTTQSTNILMNLGWEQLGDSNFDIPCTQKIAHKTGIQPRKNPHGIDTLFSYFDPYSKKQVSLSVESKHRKWDGISSTTLQSFVDQLLMTIECGSTDPTLRELGATEINTGLLMVWCNEPELFDEEKYNKYISELKVRSRKIPITIYVASNIEILKWCSLIEKIKELKAKFKEFQFFYPSGYFSGGSTASLRIDNLNLVHMFSKYIFAKSKQIIENTPYSTSVIDVNHVFFFATPTLDELNFMYSCIKDFQHEDAKKLIIHLYGQQTQYRTYIEQFKRTKLKDLESQKSQLIIEYDYMNILHEVPENYSY